MTKESTAETIFFAALEKESPGDRAAYLDEACRGDDELRRRVERLLGAHPNVGSFLQEPLAERPPPPPGTLGDTQTHAAGQDEASDVAEMLTPSQEPGHLGRLDHYEILQVVGHGGMGVVLKAFDDKLHRVVAIKVMARDLAAGAAARQRFTREARAAAAVSHDHVVTIHAVEEEHRPPYLVMQFVDGVSLQQKLEAHGALGLNEILRIGLQIAEGLAAAHRQGLVHRDIKPANILLENGVERVKITDFGLARAAADASLTQSGAVTGTPLYMSPEQASGAAVDHRSDLFSMGSVLYAMCTGRPPFGAGHTHAVLRRVIEETPRPIREVNADIPAWLCDLIARLHAKNPADRFQSAREVADLLGQHLAQLQQPSQGAAPTSAGKPPPPARDRGRRRAAPVAAVVLLGLGAGAFLAYRAGWLSRSPESSRPQHAGPGSGPATRRSGDVAPPVEAARQAAAITPASGEVLDELRRGVALQQENLDLARVNHSVGRISRLNLCVAEILLLEARVKLEKAEQKPVTALLEELVRLREEEAKLVDVRFELGVAPQTEVLSARTRLSDARARLAAARAESPATQPATERSPG
jgi:hypothetical protein